MAVSLKPRVTIPPLVAAGNAHVTEIHGVTSNLQFRYRFSLFLYDLKGRANGLQEQVGLRIQNISPLFKFESTVSSRPHQNSEWYYLDGDSVPKITLTFFECEDWAVSKYFMIWRQLQMDTDGVYYPPSFYKNDVTVIMTGRQLGTDKTSDDDETRKITYIDCFPEEISASELDYSSSNPVTIDVTLSVDGIKIE